MSLLHLFDNFTDANWQDIQQGASYTEGHIFQTTAPLGVTKLGWRRSHIGATGKVVALALWDAIGPRLMVVPAAPTDNGDYGWQWTTLDRAYVLAPYHPYVVAMYFAANQYSSRYTIGSIPTPPGTLLWVNNFRGYRETDYLAYPTTFDAQYAHGVDVEVDTTITSPIDQPSGSGDVAQAVVDLEAYIDTQRDTILSYVSSENTPSQYSIPNQIKTQIGDVVGELGDDVSGILSDIKTSVGTGLAGKVDDIKTSVGTGLNTAVSTLKSSWDLWRGAASTVWDDVATGIQAGADFWAQIGTYTGWTPLTMGAKMVGFLGGLMKGGSVPATGWTNTASTTWTGGIAWAEPADLYVITITTAPAEAGSTVTEGLTMYRRGGWWAPLNSTQVGERHYLDWATNEVHILPQQLPGIELHYGPGWEGTIDAWVFTG